eukprot:TRINITY_DN21336_c0_g1_i1.p1 TRINITY_DN21336_c0_g1~~TRINITY_DN21336_c0_g1_i1.p1  ORF type:complete len:370 (+),score=75.57 TRINITY_DN21336_c0_g1_i1:81-1112(+)
MARLLVYVARDEGDTLPVELAGDATVAELKQQVGQQIGLPAASVRLTYQGAELATDKAELADCGVGAEAVVHLKAGLSARVALLLGLRDRLLVIARSAIDVAAKAAAVEQEMVAFKAEKDGGELYDNRLSGIEAALAARAEDATPQSVLEPYALSADDMAELKASVECDGLRAAARGHPIPAHACSFHGVFPGLGDELREARPREEWGMQGHRPQAKAVLWVDPNQGQDAVKRFRQECETSLGLTFFAIESNEPVPPQASRMLQHMSRQLLCVITNRGRGDDERAAFTLAAQVRRQVDPPLPVVVYSTTISKRECDQHFCHHASNLQRLGGLLQGLCRLNSKG